MVSVCVLSYNHENYIRQCLDGIMMQEVSFPIEVIVHDDASKDRSQQIIQEYVQKYPDIVKPILQKENQYSKGKSIMGHFLFPKCTGKYVALCEGDDYWTDTHKLQRQVDFLEAHPDYVALAENGLVRNEVTNTEYPFSKAPSRDINMEEVIITRRFPTAGVLCKRIALNDYINTCRISVDTILWCWLLSKGKFRYEQTISSVYRKGQQGMTVYTEPYKFAKTIEKWNREILRVFDEKRSFMFMHIAKIYKSFIMPSIRQRHYKSAAKCCAKCGIFLIKSIYSKIFC